MEGAKYGPGAACERRLALELVERGEGRDCGAKKRGEKVEYKDQVLFRNLMVLG